MPRRVSLPGADELFRTTGGAALQAPQPRQHNGAETQSGRPPEGGDGGQRQDRPQDGEAGPRPGAPDRDSAEYTGPGVPPGPRRPITAERAGIPSAAAGAVATATVSPQLPPPAQNPGPVPPPASAGAQPPAGGRRKSSRQNRRPSGRERHDEKITVYVSAEELMDLEHARLVLRGEHGLAIDRGRIVREAVAVVLADLESRGDASILVRRLRGR
ncbi:hypothetical protein [Actinacidiphila sp. ITFR-21]|uniref:hypothetical protein n=1 Tax=Actinacidiphila sp. ITFR-21 TaxID=3075199 RepID=UPI00288A5682|nr:hypothetical protein [Streptomyces sp. ITFR-21]WNI14914.1 hypothetical protein RLT57_04760 [Streptomyces sp. ITFR-21]